MPSRCRDGISVLRRCFSGGIARIFVLCVLYHLVDFRRGYAPQLFRVLLQRAAELLGIGADGVQPFAGKLMVGRRSVGLRRFFRLHGFGILRVVPALRGCFGLRRGFRRGLGIRSRRCF